MAGMTTVFTGADSGPTLTVADAIISPKDALAAALDIINWMSGSPDFGAEGRAGDGWKEIQPRLERIRSIERQLVA